jgi:CRISPR-associated protein Csb2
VPLTIMVRLRHGRYDAGAERPGDAEWPPHPARVFCALAASASGQADWAVLRWLESQPAPQVHADPAARVRAGRASAYVVENATSAKGGNQSWPGRTNGMRSRAFAVPVTDSFAVVWPQADPPPGVLARLAGLAGKVPYVGRSTSMAEVTVSATIAGRPGMWAVYQAAPLGDPSARWQLRVPYRGYADELEAAYCDGRRSWEVARVLPYTVTDDLAVPAGGGTGGQPAAVRGPFEDLMVWSLTPPVVRIGGDQVVALAGALRKAVIARVPDPVPAQVSGHGAPGRPHVGFLALPDAGHEHADGHILGFALAIPRDLAPADLAQLVKAVILNPLSELHVGRGRVLGLRYGADRYGLQPARWAARGDGGTREWATVTPLMLDGHLRRGRDEASEVARSVVIAGYPRPGSVEVSQAPLAEGAIWRPRPGTLPAGRPHRRLVHARVTFPVPVTGPVLAGSMRYLGLGLFMPLPPGPYETDHRRRAVAREPVTAAGRIGPREP